ncbi:intraflagellar transport protein 80 homolog [Corticium candelabrum]|uniref:intraflagellar transport protein 80 homolog n=1 Tax=Corticium candelabrum TaxID=121492 RepID=UPI002E25B2C9|nr:intraflagellar transport protein 80 homolog [Corticium candelabrum]
MKLRVILQKKPIHSELVSCVGWSNCDLLYSCGDDHQLLKWDVESNDVQQVAKLAVDVFPTDLHWFPISVGSKRHTTTDLFVMAATDGKFHFLSRLGRVEKSVDAHRGAVLMSRWSHDGTALVTVGEDGQVKIWSRSGMLRSTLTQTSSPVYAVAWAPDSDQVLYSSDKHLVIKPLQPSQKPTSWKAHDNLILGVDWSSVNHMIISGGEDRRYKVWDAYGRHLFTGQLHDYPITSVSWSPDGELFAVGSFNTLRLCDKAGWSYSLEKPNTGSVLRISWTTDGTQLAGACGSGHVILAHVNERRFEWRNFEVTVQAERQIQVRDIVNNTTEDLEFPQRIVKACLSWAHFVVTTSSQCYTYNCSNWSSPVTFDLRDGSVCLIVLAEKQFLLVDSVTGLQIYTYGGRVVCTPKLPSVQAAVLNQQIVSLSNDTLVIRDKDEKVVHVFDTASGKPVGDGKPFSHTTEILEIAVDQCGPVAYRQLSFIDKNKDIYLTRIRQHGAAAKAIRLGSMVTSIAWNDNTNMLAAIRDGKFTVWLYPGVVYIDKDILTQTVYEKQESDFGREPHIVQFIGNHCVVRRIDGPLVIASVSPYPAILHQYAITSRWQDAVRLCRFAKDETLWACLAAMSAGSKELNIAELAYAAIHEASKVQYINYIKEVPSPEGRTASLALFCHQPGEAENTLLQAGLVYRAIELNINLFNWDRALKIAIKHKTHVDTVIAFRQKYLQDLGKDETDKLFLKCSEETVIDWTTIQTKISSELERERERPGAKPYS